MKSPLTLADLVAAGIENLGWDIDGETWDRLAIPMKLPMEARFELVDMVRFDRANHRYRRTVAPRDPPSQSRKELAHLSKLARDLAKGMKDLRAGAGVAVCHALLESNPPRALLDRFETAVTDAERLRDLLHRAVEIAHSQRGVPGGDRSLRMLVANLDRFLIRHTGKGLVRASERTKGRGGRGTACLDFVLGVSDLVFGERVSSATVDDAIKDVIKHRPSVGNI